MSTVAAVYFVNPECVNPSVVSDDGKDAENPEEHQKLANGVVKLFARCDPGVWFWRMIHLLLVSGVLENK